MKKYVAIGAITAALIVGVSSGQQPIRVGMAFDAGGKNDKSFNQSAYEGAQRAAKDFKAEVKDFEPADPSQVGQGIRNFAQSGFDVVVGVGFANEPSITATAKDFKDVKFAVVDSVPAGDNTTGLVFREHEGSFLVGYIAGKTSSTGVVGFVGGMDIPLIHKFDAGYVAGVKAACPTCKVISNYVGTTPTAWNDPAKAKEIATNQNSQGADIIYAAAGASGLGVVNYIKDTKCVSSAKLPMMAKRSGYFRAASLATALCVAVMLFVFMGQLMAQTFTDNGFSSEVLVSVRKFQTVGFTFAPDGRVFVWEKPGIVKIVKNGETLPTPFIDI